MERYPDWKRIPYEYAVMCIALGLTAAQSLSGFKRRMQPEEILFEVEEFSEEQISVWNEL